MTKIFYDHLTIIEEVETELDRFDLTSEEKSELMSLVDQNVHHEILNTILNNLPKDNHDYFLKKFHAAPHDKKLLEYLKKEIKIDIEKEIKAQSKKIKAEIIAEIKKAKLR